MFADAIVQRSLELPSGRDGSAGACAANAVPMPATTVVAQLVDALVTAGGGDLDDAAMATMVFDKAGLKR